MGSVARETRRSGLGVMVFTPAVHLRVDLVPGQRTERPFLTGQADSPSCTTADTHCVTRLQLLGALLGHLSNRERRGQ